MAKAKKWFKCDAEKLALWIKQKYRWKNWGNSEFIRQLKWIIDDIYNRDLNAREIWGLNSEKMRDFASIIFFAKLNGINKEAWMQVIEKIQNGAL